MHKKLILKEKTEKFSDDDFYEYKKYCLKFKFDKLIPVLVLH